MTENKNDQHSQQAVNNSGQKSTQRNADLPRDKMTIQVQEIEEWDVVIPDQRHRNSDPMKTIEEEISTGD